MKNTGSKKISERYAHALFEVAVKSNCVASIEKDFADIAALIKENADFSDFLVNPLLTRSAQATIIGNLLKQFGANAVTTQFLTLLARHKRLGNLHEMIILFLEKAATARGEMAAEAVVASAISPAEAKTIEDSLSKAYNRKINLTVKENPALLGGAIIKVGSQQLDGSLAGKLNRLQQALKAA